MTGGSGGPHGDRWQWWPPDGGGSDDRGGHGGVYEPAEHPAETTMPLPPVDDRYDWAGDGSGQDPDPSAGATPLDRLGWGDPGPERRRPSGRVRTAGPVAGRVVMAAALVVAVFGAGGIAALANSGGPDVIAEPGRSGLATPTRPVPIRPAPSRDLEPTVPPAPAQEFPPRTAPGPAITPGTSRPVPVQPPITGADEPAPSSPDADDPAAGDGEPDDATGGAADDEDQTGSPPAPRSGAPADGDDSDDAAESAEPTYSERPDPEADQERAADDPPAGPTRLIPIRPDRPEQPPAAPETTAPDAAPPATTPPATTPPETTPPTTSAVPPTLAPTEDPDRADEPDDPPARTVGPIVIPAEPDGSLPVGPIVIPTGPDGALPTGTVTATPTPDQYEDQRGDRVGDPSDTTTSATSTPSATTTARGPAPQPGDQTGDGAPAPGGSAGRAGSGTGAPITSGSLPPAAGRLSALLPARPEAAWECRPLAPDVPGAPLSGRWFTCAPAGAANPPPANPAASTAAAQPRPVGRGRRRAPSSRSGLEVV